MSEQAAVEMEIVPSVIQAATDFVAQLGPAQLYDLALHGPLSKFETIEARRRVFNVLVKTLGPAWDAAHPEEAETQKPEATL